MSYLFGIPNVAFVVGPDGRVTLAPGVPITTLGPPSQAVTAGLVTDSDVFPAPAVAAGAVSLSPGLQGADDAILAPTAAAGAATLAPTLVDDSDTLQVPTLTAPGAVLSILPPLYSDVEALFRPLADLVTPPHNTQHARPGAIASDDAIYAASLVTGRLSPALVPADDIIPATAASASNTLRPALVPDADGIFVPGVANIRLGLQPSTVASDDAVPNLTVTLFLQPAFVANDDAIASADVGWKCFAGLVAEDDQFFDAGVSAYYEILPDVYEEQEHLENYEFRVHELSGGIPAPQGDHLTGSVRPPLRVLKGNLKQKIHLTGSLTNQRRVLKGSMRSVSYNNKGRKR